MVLENHCLRCIHHRKINCATTQYCCHYLLDTGAARGCPVSACDKRADKGWIFDVRHQRRRYVGGNGNDKPGEERVFKPV